MKNGELVKEKKWERGVQNQADGKESVGCGTPLLERGEGTEKQALLVTKAHDVLKM